MGGKPKDKVQESQVLWLKVRLGTYWGQDAGAGVDREPFVSPSHQVGDNFG